MNLFFQLILFSFYIPLFLFQAYGERKNFYLFLFVSGPAFLSYFYILTRTASLFAENTFSRFPKLFFDRFTKTPPKFVSFGFSKSSFTQWIGLGFVLRILFYLTPPTLSEDVYRFLWDGLLVSEGISPFSFLPGEFSIVTLPIEKSKLASELLREMNSLRFYSVYPPVLQFLFYLSAQGMCFFNKIHAGILIWKSFLFFSEIGILWFLLKMLKEAELSQWSVLIYWLNPLVLLEIGGNGHPESILVFCLLVAVWYLWRWIQTTRTKDVLIHFIFLIFGILTKITPLILVSLSGWILFRRKKIRLLILFYLLPLLGLFAGIVFFPEWAIKQKTSGIGVFFQLFEFNGSIYYILREFLKVIGEDFYKSGRICGITALVLILLYSFWKRKEESLQKIFKTVEGIYLLFLIFATTVHPWYILPLLALSVFSQSIAPMVWSLVILVSYSTYTVSPYEDSFVWLGVEYGVLFLFLHIDYKLISSLKESSQRIDSKT
ncbi:glycosyltransferase family 39 protein [Leptospira sp. WS92.C1]